MAYTKQGVGLGILATALVAGVTLTSPYILKSDPFESFARRSKSPSQEWKPEQSVMGGTASNPSWVYGSYEFSLTRKTETQTQDYRFTITGVEPWDSRLKGLVEDGDYLELRVEGDVSQLHTNSLPLNDLVRIVKKSRN